MGEVGEVEEDIEVGVAVADLEDDKHLWGETLVRYHRPRPRPLPPPRLPLGPFPRRS